MTLWLIALLLFANKTAPPQITAQPQSVAVTAPAPATFKVAANGSKLSYQWLLNGVNIPGATLASYTTPATTLAMNGEKFLVAVSNGGGQVQSGTATLTVSAAPQTLTMAATFTMPGATVGAAYSANVATVAKVTLNGVLGCSGCAYAVTSGTLPAGLTLSPTTSVISGTPTTAATFSFTIQVTAPSGLKRKIRVGAHANPTHN